MSTELKAVIQRLAGQNAFEKGQALHAEKAIIAYQLDKSVIRAQVQGTYVYDVKLNIVDNGFDGGCSCPASEGFDFCKHCVAVALHYEEELVELTRLLSGEPADRVKGYLQTLDKDTLAEHLFSLISKDLDVLNQWTAFADIAIGNIDLKELRKRIVKALPLRDVWRYQQVRNYFDKARAQISLLLDIFSKLPPEQDLLLSEASLSRYDKILERIDDSGGFRFGVFYILEKHYIQVFRRLEQDTQTKLAYLMTILENEYLYIDFGDVGAKFISEDDTELQEKYYQALRNKFEKISHQNGKTSQKIKAKIYANSLAVYYRKNGNYKDAIHFVFEAKLNFVQSLEVLIKVIDAKEYKLAEFYLPRLAELAKTPDEQVQAKMASLALKEGLGLHADAETLAWDIYAQSLEIEDFKHLRRIAQRNGKTASAIKQKTKALLLAATSSELPYHQRNYSALFEFYLETKQLKQAIRLIEEHDFSDGQRQELAYHCLKQGMENEAIVLYKNIINAQILRGHTKDYRIAVDLIAEIIELSSHLKNPSATINALLAELSFTHANKPSFIKLLEISFNDLQV